MRLVTTSAGIALLAATALLWSAPASAQGFPWWRDPEFTRELRLTKEQSTTIEAIFQKAQPALRKQREALESAEASFELLIYAASEDDLRLHARRVESTRARLNVTRTMMLIRMRAVLDADQRVKLGALHEAWERRRTR